MNTLGFVVGFIVVIIDEIRSFKSLRNLYRYLVLLLVVGAPLYGLTFMSFGNVPLEKPDFSKPILGNIHVTVPPIFENTGYGKAPLADIMLFYIYAIFSKFTEQVSDGAVSQTVPRENAALAPLLNLDFFNITTPPVIGIDIIIIFAGVLWMTYVSGFAIQAAAASIGREKLHGTMYILAASPQSRVSLYVAKFLGAFIPVLPMSLVLYIGTRWICNSYFVPLDDTHAAVLGLEVLAAGVATSLLFSSAGMLISLSGRTAESNERISGWLVMILGVIGTVWTIWPLLRMNIDMFRADSILTKLIEGLFYLSPFSLDMMSLYSGSWSLLFWQAALAGILLVAGAIIFSGQDIE